MHLLDGITEETVDFTDNYSGEREEPTVLPSRYPNLLVNGSTGIAVGMATNIPPHNLNEVVDACLHALDHPDATVEDLMDFVRGPDFPTGGYIVGNKGVKEALLTGRGSVKMRAVTDVVEIKKKRVAIIVTEIPYQVSIRRIMEKIAELVNNKVVTGISGLRDESNRNGIRIVIELKRDANPQVVLNQLYKGTQLEENFSVNTVALVGRGAEDPEPGGDGAVLPRAPDRGRGASHPVPTSQGRGAGRTSSKACSSRSTTSTRWCRSSGDRRTSTRPGRRSWSASSCPRCRRTTSSTCRCVGSRRWKPRSCAPNSRSCAKRSPGSWRSWRVRTCSVR